MLASSIKIMCYNSFDVLLAYMCNDHFKYNQCLVKMVRTTHIFCGLLLYTLMYLLAKGEDQVCVNLVLFGQSIRGSRVLGFTSYRYQLS